MSVAFSRRWGSVLFLLSILRYGEETNNCHTHSCLASVGHVVLSLGPLHSFIVSTSIKKCSVGSYSYGRLSAFKCVRVEGSSSSQCMQVGLEIFLISTSFTLKSSSISSSRVIITPSSLALQ